MESEDQLKSEIMALSGEPTIGELARAHPDVVSEFRKLNLIETATTFSGLLTTPKLQANCLRIEALIHLAAAYCDGRGAPTRGLVRRSFERLGAGICGMMENPSEDVFATLVNTPRGNFRIFEGIREAAGFYLQRILNIVEGMPDEPHFVRIRGSIECLLRLSDEVAARAGVQENCLGQEMPLSILPTGSADRLSSGRSLLRFTEDDLSRLRIPKHLLTEFALGPSDRSALPAQSAGHTALERRPLLDRGEHIYVVLPTAIASAITRFVIEEVISMGLADVFESALGREFTQLFSELLIRSSDR